METPVSNYTKHIQSLDNANHLHPFTVHPELRAKGPRVITSAKGVYLVDSEGNKILDGMSGLWCVNLGYGVEELARAGYEAFQTLSYYNTFFQTTTPPAAELAKRIASVTPGDLDHIFFASSGSEANDSAVKLIWYYWNLKNKPNKKAIISRQRSYHGSTAVAASITGLEFMHTIFDLPFDRFHHISPPPHQFEYGEPGESEEAFAARAAKSLEDKILELGPDNVAAFIGEPVMGAGGLMFPPKGYWQHIQEICRKYDVLLWSDEVICGFGRTGNWFGCQTYGFQPDIITMAKGLSSGYQPISAVALSEEVGGTISAANAEMAHGFTYSGHPVGCAVALKVIDLMEDAGIIGDRGQETADYFQQKLRMLDDHPLVGNTRGIGLLGAIELVKDKATAERFPDDVGAGMVCRTHCFNNGLVSRAVGDTMMLAPPLVISKSEIDELFEKMRLCLDLTYADLKTD